ncbi:MAG: metallopeptidase TldD-related protein, partial [Betaproteobacteria bacterium]|nr:metallopeptidase TldD-related protein [Betaproteobacteria bacterium]
MTAFVQPAAPPRASAAASPSRSGADGGRFPLPTVEIERIAASVLAAAKAGGATAAETDVSQAVGQSVTVRCGEVETVAYNRDKGIGVTVYLGQRRGHASTADFSADAVHAAVGKALAIARFTAEDPAAGLADPDRLARVIPDLDLFDPWELNVEDAVALGCDAEASALAVDRRLTNTEGATVAWSESEFVYANTHGFSGGYRSTRHHIDCSVIGDPGDGGAMQRDYWYTAGRGASDLQSASEVGRIAGERTVRRLGARKLGTVECPVLFEAPEAGDLIGAFVGAVSGGALYRKSSFLLDSLGQQVFSPNVSICEDPHIPRARGSA